jgi:hypothetical protein
MIKRILMVAALYSVVVQVGTAYAQSRETCTWVASTTIELRNLKVQGGFPEFALKRLGVGYVELEREDGFLAKAKLNSILEGFVELLFDPEMEGLIDGSLSEEVLFDIFYTGCEAAM